MAEPALSLRGLTKRYDDGFLALEGFDLASKAQVRAPKLSGGMRRRLLLARAHAGGGLVEDDPRTTSRRPRSCARRSR